jgi:hypothetical protein
VLLSTPLRCFFDVMELRDDTYWAVFDPNHRRIEFLYAAFDGCTCRARFFIDRDRIFIGNMAPARHFVLLHAQLHKFREPRYRKLL